MQDDTERFQALARYGILDTPPEPEFDDIVQLARRLCHTPVALVSLVDRNRQWFKATAGFQACETPLDQSVCAHAIKEAELLVIPDLTLDIRTRDNTLVTEPPHIRFYAGAVLRDPSGVALGTLCVIDDKPRPEGLTADQSLALRALGRQTMALIEMRNAVSRRDEALEAEHRTTLASIERAREIQLLAERQRLDVIRMRLAQEAGGVGTFEVDLDRDEVIVSARLCSIFGLPEQPSYPAGVLESHAIAEDRVMVSTTQSRRSGSTASAVEYRIRRASDQEIRWISRRAEYFRDADGRVSNLLGIVQDVTERKQAEARQKALLALGDALRDASCLGDVTASASRALGEALAADRAGIAILDHQAGLLTVHPDWAAGRGQSLIGTHQLADYAATIAALQAQGALAVDDLDDAPHLLPDRPSFEALGTRAILVVPLTRRGGAVDGLLYVHAGRPRRWTAEELTFAEALADRTYAAIGRIRAEAEEALLNEELAHRLKNTLALVSAIATQTLRKTSDPQAFRAFNDRILALSQAHDVLLQRSWTSARISSVIDNVMTVQTSADRYRAHGPDLNLGPRAVLSASMLLHELATNAVKYGALSNDRGTVSIQWRIAGPGADAAVKLVWTESGGPPATPPEKRGFGSRLIELGLAGAGGVELRYDDGGLTAEFTAPMTMLA